MAKEEIQRTDEKVDKVELKVKKLERDVEHVKKANSTPVQSPHKILIILLITAAALFLIGLFIYVLLGEHFIWLVVALLLIVVLLGSKLR